MQQKIVLFTFIFSLVASPALPIGIVDGGHDNIAYKDIDAILISRVTTEVNTMLEYNGPWFTDAVTILIETNGETLSEITQAVNKFDFNYEFFEGTEVKWTMFIEQNPELFYVSNELSYLEPHTFLLLTVETPMTRVCYSCGMHITI